LGQARRGWKLAASWHNIARELTGPPRGNARQAARIAGGFSRPRVKRGFRRPRQGLRQDLPAPPGRHNP